MPSLVLWPWNSCIFLLYPLTHATKVSWASTMYQAGILTPPFPKARAAASWPFESFSTDGPSASLPSFEHQLHALPWPFTQHYFASPWTTGLWGNCCCDTVLWNNGPQWAMGWETAHGTCLNLCSLHFSVLCMRLSGEISFLSQSQ